MCFSTSTGNPMTTLKVGVASYKEMKARTMAVARGERRVAADEPKVWFTSTESFAKVLSAGNRDLLRSLTRYYKQCDIQLLPFLRDEKDWPQLIEVLERFAETMPEAAPLNLQ